MQRQQHADEQRRLAQPDQVELEAWASRWAANSGRAQGGGELSSASRSREPSSTVTSNLS